MNENEYNVKDSKSKRYNYIYNYISSVKKKKVVKEYLLRLDSEVYEDFRRVASAKFGLHYGANLLVEALMKMFIEEFKDSPTTIQATLFYKPKIEKVEVKQEQNVNIGLKLKVKMVVQDLEFILKALEEKRGDYGFYLNRLRQTVEKASKLYTSTRNEQLRILLERAEKWI